MRRGCRLLITLGALSLAVVAGSCGDSSSSGRTPTSSLADRVVGTWVLRDVSPQPAGFPPATELTLEVRADGTFLANDCNPQLGPWRVESGRVEFFDVMKTAVLCRNPPDMLAGFVATGRLNRDGTELVIETTVATTATYVRR